MAKCKQCGKFVFLSSSLKDDLCSNCYKIISDKQNLANQLDEMQQELEIKKAEDYFDEISNCKKLTNISIEKASIEDLDIAIEAHDKFISLVENLPLIPYISDVIVPKLSRSRYSINYYVEGIGSVVYDKNNELLNFDVAISNSKKEKNTLENIISSSKTFNNIYSSIKNVDISLAKPNSNYVYSLSEFPIIKTTNITSRTPISNLNHFIVIDVETTGLKPFENEIIELSAVRFIGFEPVECYSTYIKPLKGINKEAQNINGITEQDVMNAPVFSEIIDSFCDFIGDKVPIVGHNISFDINFLIASGINSLLFFKRKVYDTLQLSKSQFPNMYSYKLDYLSRLKLNVIRNNSHTATSDSLICGMLFKEICKKCIKF